MKKIAVVLATFFGVGHIRLAPGTWASLLTTLVLYFIIPYLGSAYPVYFAFALLFLLGIPAARQCEKHFQRKDPRQCVIDEVAGQMVSLFFLPHRIWLYLGGFLLFRFFDVLKPFPIKKSERLPHGIGVMADDLLAGLYALGVMQLLRALL